MPSPLQEYRDWKQKSDDVGCMFARWFADERPGKRYKTAIVEASSTPSRISNSVERKIAQACEDPTVQGIGLVLPNVDQIEKLTEAVIDLRDSHGWIVDATKMSKLGFPDLVALRVSRLIASEHGGEVPSEGLFLGQFPNFPNTRLSPFTALEIFTGVALAEDPKSKEVANKANLAHMTPPELPKLARLWDISEKKRLESLGGIDDKRAKAKVSLVIHHSVADALGVQYEA